MEVLDHGSSFSVQVWLWHEGKTLSRCKQWDKKFSAELENENDKVLNEKAFSINQSLLAELTQNKELLKVGNGDSSSGSDSEPSGDNLEATELVKNLPAVDKSLSIALKQEAAVKKEQAKQRA